MLTVGRLALLAAGLLFDEAGELHATLIELCAGDHAIRSEVLDPPPDDR